jgi:N-sulfoglucosamine sulfohydrolase
MYRFVCSMLAILWFGLSCATVTAAARPNLLLITVDDMNANSVGVFGSTVPDTTPNIDQLAREGMRFERAHVQVANCAPSRNVMWSGRYPHTNKVEGFDQVRDPGYETMSDLMQGAGYFTAIRHKVNNSTPYYPYAWDLVLDNASIAAGHHKSDPASYGFSTTEGIDAAKSAGKPFALLINIGDPHIPFYGMNKRGDLVEDAFRPSRIYGAEEISVPGFLVEDPVIRQELAHYYSSVRRADDAVGNILSALEDSGEADNTLVMFLSDHGMPFPFAKTQLYHHSTWTPLIFRWPGIIKENSIDDRHMISAIDILPTLLRAINVQPPQGIEGRSFLPLLKGGEQENRDTVIKEYHENSDGNRAPMRAAQSSRFLYIFNPWSNGNRAMQSATFHTNTYKRMVELARDDEKLAKRMSLLKHRVVEEFYDIQSDPDCLVNLISDPSYKKEIEYLQSALEDEMRRTNDPALKIFVNRANQQALEEYMHEPKLTEHKRRNWIQTIKHEIKALLHNWIRIIKNFIKELLHLS